MVPNYLFFCVRGSPRAVLEKIVVHQLWSHFQPQNVPFSKLLDCLWYAHGPNIVGKNPLPPYLPHTPHWRWPPFTLGKNQPQASCDPM